ncbi:MAG: MlaD family protein [Hyphomonas sp.]
METRANYALIGAFVVLATVAVLGFVLWLGNSQFRQDFKAYDVVFEGPVSLEEGSSVRYIGIKVGEVSWVRIDRADTSKVRARIRIDRETPVRDDSMASIQLAGITGTTFVQISAGTGEALEARAGQPVPVIRSERTQLDELFAGGTQVLGKANLTVERLNALLTDENIEAFSNTIGNLDAITTSMAAPGGLVEQASGTLKDVSNASIRFDAASASLQKFGDTADVNIKGVSDQVGLLIGDMRVVTESANVSIQESTRAVSAAADAIEGPATDALRDARLASQDLRMLINRLDRLARDVEQDPQSLIVGDPIPYEGGRR